MESRPEMMLTVMFPVFFRTKHYTFALWSREVPRLLPDIDPQGGVVPQELFPIFFQELASVFFTKAFHGVSQIVDWRTFPFLVWL